MEEKRPSGYLKHSLPADVCSGWTRGAVTVDTHDSAGHRSTLTRSFWDRDVILVFAVTCLAYANISVFFQFYEYLQTLSIDPRWFGLLMSVFSAVSLVVRPFISTVFHAENALRFLVLGALLVAAALLSYGLAEDFLSLLFVRAFHGLGFVILGTALMAMTVQYIPEEKSGQAFGLRAIVILIPTLVIPPLLPFMIRNMGSFPAVLMLFAGVTVLVLPVIGVLRNHRSSSREEPPCSRLNGAEILKNLQNRHIIGTLGAMLLLYSTFALIFFFLAGFGSTIGISNVGVFFTVALTAEIVIRIVAGSLFDRFPKHHLAGASMALLAGSYALLATARSVDALVMLAVLVGLGWGVAMPVFNGLMFDLSPPRFRPFNVNIGLQMFQGGFFFGPFIGGFVVASWNFTTLFHVCAAMSGLSMVLVLWCGADS